MGFISKVGKGVKGAVKKATGPSLEDQWKEYRAEIAAIEAEEARLREEQRPNECTLFCYWWLSLFACFELVPRTLIHCFLFLFSGLLWLLTCGNWKLPYEAIAHHSNMIHIYTGWFPDIICHNLCREPCNPIYVCTDDVSIERPSPPPPLGGNASDCCKCDCCTCNSCCDDCCNLFENMFNRFMRATLFSYGHCHSCHPSFLCGPLCPIETIEERLDRWEQEMARDKQRRTEAFRRKYHGTHGVAQNAPGLSSMDHSDYRSRDSRTSWDSQYSYDDGGQDLDSETRIEMGVMPVSDMASVDSDSDDSTDNRRWSDVESISSSDGSYIV